jgi:hypothetical protein
MFHVEQLWKTSLSSGKHIYFLKQFQSGNRARPFSLRFVK